MSIEDKLKKKTPTNAELENRRMDERKEKLIHYAKTAARSFSGICERYAERGYHGCWNYATSSEHCSEDFCLYYIRLTDEPDYRTGYHMSTNRYEVFIHEKDLFVSLLESMLKEQGFSNTKVEPEIQYFNLGGLFGRRKGYIFFKLSTTW